MALYLEDKKMSIKELLAAVGLKDTDVPYKKRHKEFEMIMKRDRDGKPLRDDHGRYVNKRKIQGTPQFSIYVDSLGYEVRVRYATTQRKDKDSGFIYTPNLISMIPGEDGTYQMADELEFVFWFLHPWCKHSPFHRKGMPAYFEYKDEDFQSKSENDLEESRINALGYIVGQHAKSITQLRAIAKGISIAGVDDMTDEVVKKKLREIAQKDPVGFINKIDSRETIFAGTIQDAIDKGILKTESLNGMIRWYLNGKEILPVPFSQDPVMALREELSLKWHLYSKEITDSLNGQTVASNLNNPGLDEIFNRQLSDKTETNQLTPEQREILKQMQEDEKFDKKIKYLASVDINAPGVHHATVTSYNKNIDAINAYKASLVPEEISA